eukprot:5479164-Pyramimonas_sp.AAC.1
MALSLGIPLQFIQESSLGALESRSRWRLACNLFNISALALELPAICSSAALPTLRHPGVLLTLQSP